MEKVVDFIRSKEGDVFLEKLRAIVKKNPRIKLGELRSQDFEINKIILWMRSCLGN